MNPGWTQALVTILGNLLIAAFVYGQLTQKQKDQGGWIKKHETRIDKHDDQLTDHERRISYVEGQRGIPRESE